MIREEEPVSSTPSSTGGVEDTHPAFGVAVVTRGSGSSRSLFQSDVLHQQSITLSIQTATRGRDLNHDWVHPRDTLVEVELSLAQWGALVSSIGIGSGVPVTIRRTENQAFVPTLPYQPRIKASLGEVTGSIDKLFARAKETLEALTDAIENKTGVRAVRDALRMHSSTITHASNNSEFAVTSLAAAGENVTSQVRADIESQILAAVRLTGHQGAISAPEIRLDDLETPNPKKGIPDEPGRPMPHIVDIDDYPDAPNRFLPVIRDLPQQTGSVEEQRSPENETCRLCLGSGRIATGRSGVNPPKATCPECHGARVLPTDHHYQDDTV